jgi:hypothetical protein
MQGRHTDEPLKSQTCIRSLTANNDQTQELKNLYLVNKI